jgi:hypothetical protein
LFPEKASLTEWARVQTMGIYRIGDSGCGLDIWINDLIASAEVKEDLGLCQRRPAFNR